MAMAITMGVILAVIPIYNLAATSIVLVLAIGVVSILSHIDYCNCLQL